MHQIKLYACIAYFECSVVRAVKDESRKGVEAEGGELDDGEIEGSDDENGKQGTAFLFTLSFLLGMCILLFYQNILIL